MTFFVFLKMNRWSKLQFLAISILVATLLSAIPVPAQDTPLSNGSAAYIETFYSKVGWHQAKTVRTAIAIGTIETNDGEGPHSIVLRIDRTGRFRSDIPDLRLSTISTLTGGALRTAHKTATVPVGQGTQLSSSLIIPIFSPLAEVGEPNIKTASFSTTAAQISIAKLWNRADNLDQLRLKSSLFIVTFGKDNMLRNVTYDIPDLSPSPRMQIEYDDFRVVEEIAIPFTVMEYVDDKLVSTIRLSSIEFNVAFNESDFGFSEEK